MPATRRLLVAFLFLVLGATGIEAQVLVSGRVIEDATAEPIPGATVELQSERGQRLGRQLTDDLGRFRFTVDEGDAVRVRAERLGYQASTTSVLRMGGYAELDLEIRLDVAAVLLAPVEVVGRSRAAESPTLAGFEQRRRSGTGWYMTREEIEQRRPNRVSNLLAGAPGVTVQRRIIYMARAGNCPAQIFVDGVHINRRLSAAGGGTLATTEMFPVDDLVPTAAVEGIEVYQGLSRVPAEFLTPESRCGVVAIWTRRGG